MFTKIIWKICYKIVYSTIINKTKITQIIVTLTPYYIWENVHRK